MASLKQYPSGYYTVRYRKDGEDCYEPTWTKDKIKAKRFKRQFLCEKKLPPKRSELTFEI